MPPIPRPPWARGSLSPLLITHYTQADTDTELDTRAPSDRARDQTLLKITKLLANAPAEYRSGATWVNGHTAIAVGPTGSDVSQNRGQTWTRFDSGSLDTVDCARPNACWASGSNGRVSYLTRSH